MQLFDIVSEISFALSQCALFAQILTSVNFNDTQTKRRVILSFESKTFQIVGYCQNKRRNSGAITCDRYENYNRALIYQCNLQTFRIPISQFKDSEDFVNSNDCT